jgi:sigma-B regulation protein RsbU (phosphoserine phosphatase)
MRHPVNADSIRTVIRADAADRETRSQQLESLKEAELTTLDPEDFLAEQLRRLCDALGLDVAAILLLDQHAQQLVTTASVGLEEEVRQRFRLPVGVGFAGKVAQLRGPITAENVNPDDIASPVLRGKNVRSLAGVPVLIDDDLVGVLKVGTFESRTFTENDIRLLQRAADRAAAASQARRNRLDSQAALALQRGLLPTRLPSVPGIDLAARYVPGQDAGVGGDWYDVFLLPDGSLGIVVGDVAGHGLPSAVVMGRLRSALRAYALEHSDPAEVLARLDRKIHHFEAGNLATAIYVVIPPDRNHARISNAGHLPPVLAVPGHQAQVQDVEPDLPLGIGADAPRRTTRIELPPESVMVLYTDGLVERRRQPIAHGLQQLLSLVKPMPAEEACQAIMAGMDTTNAFDDIALLTFRRASATTPPIR